MFGKKKKLDNECPEAPKPQRKEVDEGADTHIIDAKILPDDKSKLLEWVFAEYKSQYHGVFSPEDVKSIDPDATSLNLLFAIFGELRLLRMLKEKELTGQK